MSKIIGNTTATPNPQANWTQTDSTKADYIKNKPGLGALAEKDKVAKTDLATDVQTSLGKADTAIQSIDGLATEDYVTGQINNLVGTAPGVYNTITKISAELAKDNDAETAILNRLGAVETKANDAYTKANQSELPTVSASNNGQFLRVVNGKWTATTIASAEGVGF